MLEILDPSTEIFSEQRKLNEQQIAYLRVLRSKANELLTFFNQIPDCRRKSIAITCLEDSVMYATKAACFGH